VSYASTGIAFGHSGGSSPCRAAKAFAKALDQRVVRIELIDGRPKPSKLVESQQIEHERGAHDAGRGPQPSLSRASRNSSLRGRASRTPCRTSASGPRLGAGCRDWSRGFSGALAHRLDRGDAHTSAPALPAGKKRKYSSPVRRDLSLNTATRSWPLRWSHATTSARVARRSRRCRAGSSTRPAVVPCRTS